MLVVVFMQQPYTTGFLMISLYREMVGVFKIPKHSLLKNIHIQFSQSSSKLSRQLVNGVKQTRKVLLVSTEIALSSEYNSESEQAK